MVATIMVMPAVLPPTALSEEVLYSLYFMLPAYQNTKKRRRATLSGAPLKEDMVLLRLASGAKNARGLFVQMRDAKRRRLDVFFARRGAGVPGLSGPACGSSKKNQATVLPVQMTYAWKVLKKPNVSSHAVVNLLPKATSIVHKTSTRIAQVSFM